MLGGKYIQHILCEICKIFITSAEKCTITISLYGKYAILSVAVRFCEFNTIVYTPSIEFNTPGPKLENVLLTMAEISVHLLAV